MTMLEKVITKCTPYASDESFVYKICLDKYIVVMQKCEDTITNEDRKDVVNPDYAKFRATKLKVIEIFDINDPSINLDQITNKYTDKYLTYIVNNVIVPDDYDNDKNKVCSNGVHYFKTVSAAIYYGQVPSNYTGKWIDRWDNGQILEEGYYHDGLRIGKWQEFHHTGQKRAEGEYVNDKKNNRWVLWYCDGQKRSEGIYVDDQRIGHWTWWYENGQKHFEDEFFGNGTTKCISYWLENGEQKFLNSSQLSQQSIGSMVF